MLRKWIVKGGTPFEASLRAGERTPLN